MESASVASICEHCNNKLPAKATAFLHDGKVVCRDCHDALEPVCPNCHKPLKAKPEVTSPCPLCGWPIHVVREQDLYDTTLLTKKQLDHLTAFRKKLGVLRRFGVTEGRYMRVKARLAQQTGQEPDDVAVMRRLFHLATKACENDADRAAVAYAEARYLYEQDQDYYHVLKRAHRHQLQAYRDAGIDGVTIDGPVETCAYCKKRAGAPLAIHHELKDPELPYPDCPNKTVQSKVFIDGELSHVGVSKHAFCEAKYRAYEK